MSPHGKCYLCLRDADAKLDGVPTCRRCRDFHGLPSPPETPQETPPPWRQWSTPPKSEDD